MSKLKSYKKNQELKTIKEAPRPSGIACTEPDCPGEMMIGQPDVNHPKLDLKRAKCGVCGWLGWV